MEQTAPTLQRLRKAIDDMNDGEAAKALLELLAKGEAMSEEERHTVLEARIAFLRLPERPKPKTLFSPTLLGNMVMA